MVLNDGSLGKLRLAKQTRFPQTAALAAPSLDPPQAALGLAAIPNTEVKLMYADNLPGDCPGR